MSQQRTNSVLDRAKIHFQPYRDEPKKIHIPEWAEEGEDGIFYATALNLKERQEIEKRAKSEIELGVEIIIRKLTDADKKRVFTVIDKPEIMRGVDPRVVARVAQEILGESDIEEAEKN